MSALKTWQKVVLGAGIYVGLIVLFGAAFGSAGKNDEFQPQNEFKLEPWIDLQLGGIDMSVNKAVFYLLLAAAATVLTMSWIARRMQEKPNRVQMVVELAYDMTRKMIVGDNMREKWAKRWFAFIASLFFFIWFSNMIGLIPLPTNTEHRVDILGVEFPTFALYAATANISVPLVLTIFVWFSYHIEGIRERGFGGYMDSFVPAGIGETDESSSLRSRILAAIGRRMLFGIEVISHSVRLISLSVRLFANILAGHLLILFMAGGLAVLLGVAALGVATFPLVIAFYLFEIIIVATLQAFIFAILTAIYIGEATAHGH